MKAAVQKTIQSLHSFGYHFFGGGIAAPFLIPLSVRLTLVVLCSSLLTVNFAGAQQKDTNEQRTTEKRLDVLFDQMMLTMPDDVRSMVDSAAAMPSQQRSPVSGKKDEKMPAANGTTPLNERMRELPDDVKAQVERTITEMHQRKEERKAQFRERQKGR